MIDFPSAGRRGRPPSADVRSRTPGTIRVQTRGFHTACACHLRLRRRALRGRLARLPVPACASPRRSRLPLQPPGAVARRDQVEGFPLDFAELNWRARLRGPEDDDIRQKEAQRGEGNKQDARDSFLWICHYCSKYWQSEHGPGPLFCCRPQIYIVSGHARSLLSRTTRTAGYRRFTKGNVMNSIRSAPDFSSSAASGTTRSA